MPTSFLRLSREIEQRTIAWSSKAASDNKKQKDPGKVQQEHAWREGAILTISSGGVAALYGLLGAVGDFTTQIHQRFVV